MAIVVGWFTLGLLLALIPAYIARSKGRSFGAIYLLSLIIFPVGLITALAIHDARRRCPACAEPVQWAANVCPHCRTEIGAQAEPAGPAERPATKTEKRILGGMIIVGALAVAGVLLFPVVKDAVTTDPPTTASLLEKVKAKSGSASCRYQGLSGGERLFECGSYSSSSFWVVTGDEIRRID